MSQVRVRVKELAPVANSRVLHLMVDDREFVITLTGDGRWTLAPRSCELSPFHANGALRGLQMFLAQERDAQRTLTEGEAWLN